jgi:hypothetical protein
MNMTPKQRTFCQEYLNGQNGTQAAINAGYSPNIAPVIASKNLRKPHIQAEIVRYQKQAEEKAVITREQVLECLMNEAKNAENSGHARVAALKALFSCLVIHERLNREDEKERRFQAEMGIYSDPHLSSMPEEEDLDDEEDEEALREAELAEEKFIARVEELIEQGLIAPDTTDIPEELLYPNPLPEIPESTNPESQRPGDNETETRIASAAP